MKSMLWTFICLLSLFAITGCTTTRTSDTSRTGIEQLLISNAIDQVLDKTPLPNVSGRKVYVSDAYLDCVDKGYVLGSIRQRLLASGAMLVAKAEDSDMTIEVRSGGIGTDNVDSFLGVPGMALPGPLPVEIPEVRLWQNTNHYGTAKIAIVAYGTDSGQVLFDSGRSLARANDSRWSVLGVGPFQSGSVRDEVHGATKETDLNSRVADTFNYNNYK
jgi:hypothetical protein